MDDRPAGQADGWMNGRTDGWRDGRGLVLVEQTDNLEEGQRQLIKRVDRRTIENRTDGYWDAV